MTAFNQNTPSVSDASGIPEDHSQEQAGAEPGEDALDKETAARPEAALRVPVPAGNTNTGTLKLIALGFMLIDHLGAVVFPRIPEMRILGRIAFPLYCWCMIVGLHYTRSVPKYLGRILLVGILSQPLYALTMNHPGPGTSLVGKLLLGKPNIFLTLFLGLAALWGIREKKYLSQLWAPAAALVLATVLGADYGWRGVFFMILLYMAQESRSGIAAVTVAYFLFWGITFSATSVLFGIPLRVDDLPGWLSTPLKSALHLETWGALSLVYILGPLRKNIRLPLWISYGIYPAHLLIVQLLKTLFR